MDEINGPLQIYPLHPGEDFTTDEGFLVSIKATGTKQRVFIAGNMKGLSREITLLGIPVLPQPVTRIS
ncbi:MAG: hypothetical protein M3410_15520 [Acidobacteriota bacterium]|nr:hypothetical protein [Acidobacteriota bacterium]